MLVFPEGAKITICICNFMNICDRVCGSEPAEILYRGPLHAKLSLSQSKQLEGLSFFYEMAHKAKYL